jgi:hypothetical protein
MVILELIANKVPSTVGSYVAANESTTSLLKPRELSVQNG